MTELVNEFTGAPLNRWRALERRAVVSSIRIYHTFELCCSNAIM